MLSSIAFTKLREEIHRTFAGLKELPIDPDLDGKHVALELYVDGEGNFAWRFRDWPLRVDARARNTLLAASVALSSLCDKLVQRESCVIMSRLLENKDAR